MKKHLFKPVKWLVLLCACMTMHIFASATIRYVDQTATGSNNGSSWTNAYTSLAEALKIAHDFPAIDSILVAQGTYVPEYALPPEDPNIILHIQDKTFYIIRDNLTVLGGYPSGGGVRNAALNTTTLSGKLNATDSSFAVMAILGATRNSNSSVHVDGFTITGGRGIYQGITTVTFYQLSGGSMFARQHGCGLQVYDCSPKLSNLIINGNRGAWAGGMHIQFSNAELSNVTVADNSSSYYGGIQLHNFSGKLDDVIIRNNFGTIAGGLTASYSSFVANNMKIIGNSANNYAAIYQYSHTATYNNLVVTGNKSTSGSVLHFTSNANNFTFNNATIAGNSTSSMSLIDNYYGANNRYVYNNCNIYGNSGGIASSASVTMKNCNVQGGYAGTNILDVNPLFIDAPAHTSAPYIHGNFGLNYCSPLLNVGDNALLHTAQTVDAKGLPRSVFGQVDIGAYEKQSNLNNFNNNVSLSNASSNNVPFIATCEEGGFTYYVDPNNADSISFAINWGANNIAAKAAAKIYIQSDNAAHLSSNNTDQAIAILPRFWNVDIGSATLQSPVSVRFYFSEADTLLMRSAINAANVGPSDEGLVWFKTRDVAYHHNLVTYNAINNGRIIKLQPTYGVVGNLKYVEFSNVRSFSGGSAMMATLDNEVLPLKLLSFEATIHNENTALLTWNTAKEQDVATIVVERSGVDETWTSITEIAPKGQMENRYSTIDSLPLLGNNMYRLKMVDYDGTFSYSQVAMVNFLGVVPANVHVYPNPTTGIVMLEGLPQAAEITMHNVVGELLLSKTTAMGKMTLDLASFPAGIYFIRIKYPNGQFSNHKIVKE